MYVCTSQSAECNAARGLTKRRKENRRRALFAVCAHRLFFPAPRKLPYFFPRSCRSPFARSRVFRSAANFLSLSLSLSPIPEEKRGERECVREKGSEATTSSSLPSFLHRVPLVPKRSKGIFISRVWFKVLSRLPALPESFKVSLENFPGYETQRRNKREGARGPT